MLFWKSSYVWVLSINHKNKYDILILMIIYIFIIIWPVSGGLLVSFFSKLSLLEERHTQLSTHEICCENLKMDTEWKNQKTVRKKCKLHIIFYVNKRTSITPHFKLIKKFKQLRKRNGQQNSVVTTVVKLALICKIWNSILYSVQDLLLDIHEEKNQSKLAMCT